MTLSDLASIGSLVSGIAVLVSLVYLNQQMRQNTKHTRALIQQGRAVQSVDLPLRWAENESLADLRMRGDAGDATLDTLQLRRYWLMLVSVFWYFEDQFHQHRDGLVDDGRFVGTVQSLVQSFQRPGFRVAWKQSRFLFGADFQSFMDGILHQTRIVLESDPVGSWNARIASELSEARG